MSGRLKLYDELASWWPVLSAPEDYAEEAAFYLQVLRDAGERPADTLLELGSGGGNNASHMKAHFKETVLVDRSPGMIAVSRRLNPDCEHLVGDMRTVRVGRQFDRVFVHDAICYMTTLDDVKQAVETAFVHCAPGGAALFCPDHVRENFRAQTDHGGHDGPERSLRYLYWMWDPDPSDSTYTVDYAYMLREGNGSFRVEHDRHIEGLFHRSEWLRVLTEAGFFPQVLPFEHSEVESGSHEVFLGIRT